MLQIVESSVLLNLGLGLFFLSKSLATWLAAYETDNFMPLVAFGVFLLWALWSLGKTFGSP